MSKSTTLTHLAIIPDGNRRWAKKHAISAQQKIYQSGGDKIFEIIQAGFELGIPNISLWISSYANLMNRSKGFVDALEIMYEKKFRELAVHPLIHDNKVRIQIHGQWRELLKPKTVEALQGAIDTTSSYNDKQLTILAGYDGHRERGAALEAILKDLQAGIIGLPPDAEAAERLLRSYSWTGYLPDVDLLVRTGAWQDPHNSAAFLSLLTSESQFSFPEVLWPDFTAGQLGEVIADFLGRERRLGQ